MPKKKRYPEFAKEIAERYEERQAQNTKKEDTTVSSIARMAFEIAAGVGISMAIPPIAPGVAASKIPMIASAGKTLMKIPSVARMFTRGAAEGAAADSFFSRPEERGPAAMRGAVAGGALSTAVPLAGRTFRGVRDFYKAAHKTPGMRGDKIIANELKGADRSILQHPEGMLADVDPGVAQHAQFNAPHNTNELIEATAKRQEGALGRFAETTQDVLDNPPLLEEITEQGAQRKVIQDKLFEEAYSEQLPRNVKSVMRKIARPTGIL